MQTLEDEAVEEEKHACQSFLQACGAALQACPNAALGVCMYPIHLLTGNMSLTSLLMAALQLTIRSRDPIPSPSCPRRPATTTHSTGTKWQHLPGWEVELDPSGDEEPTCHPQGAAPMKAEGGGSSSRILMSSRSWQKWQASWTLKSTRFRTSDRVKRSSMLPIAWLGGLPRTYITSRWCQPQNPPRSGPKGDTLP